ncbi:MAG TPA: hypothetical protein VMF13_16200, partial [Luteitalea sp.]|nr:hypothetical protein [Luteitalea sp.]
QAIWRDFDWQAVIPDGTSIEFAAQSGDDAATLMPASPALPVSIAKAIASTDTGPNKTNYDAALLDTGMGGQGAFNLADPPVLSKNLLRVLITLNPTTDKKTAPRLAHWKVQYDCQLSD